jgi:hypothetical protein
MGHDYLWECGLIDEEVSETAIAVWISRREWKVVVVAPKKQARRVLVSWDLGNGEICCAHASMSDFFFSALSPHERDMSAELGFV